MKNVIRIFFICLLLLQLNSAQSRSQNQPGIPANNVAELKELLTNLAAKSDNKFFVLHCKSILNVIDSKNHLTKQDTLLLGKLYEQYIEDSLSANPGHIETYLERKRELIIAWTSPGDGTVSFTWLKLPKNWNPDTLYPLYVELHGYWDVADNPVDYLTCPLIRKPSSSIAFEDGYFISPWGRGNLWYKGISETDISDCIATIEALVKVDTARRYLWGFSMGGFGVMHISQQSVETWAAFGMHSPAFHHNHGEVLKNDIINRLKNVPMYFICGTNDGNRRKTRKAYKMMAEAGNKNIEFSSFEGGHIYNENEIEKMYCWMRQFKK